MKLVDKAAVVAEIEEVISGLRRNCNPNPLGNIQECLADAEIEALNLIKDYLDTLGVKEVDLEKEINDYFNAWQNVLCDEDCCNEGGFCCVLDENVKLVNIERCRKVAKHFFELGMTVSNKA